MVDMPFHFFHHQWSRYYMRNKLNILSLLVVVAFLAGCKGLPFMTPKNQFSRFTGIQDFSGFTQTAGPGGKTVLLSPAIKAGIDWKELIVSWNAEAHPGSTVEV